MAIVFSDEIKLAWEDVKNDKTDTNFLVLAKGSDNKTAEIVAQGTGGYDEFISHLKDDSINFGAFRGELLTDTHTLSWNLFEEKYFIIIYI